MSLSVWSRRARRCLLQPPGHLRAVHQGRQGRDQVDPPVVPLLRGQCRPPPASCPCLQPWQLHADAGDAEDGGAVVGDQPARVADQDRREGRQPRSLRDIPDGRGRSAATNVPRNPVADCAAAGTARGGMTRRATRFSASARSTGGFDRLPRTRHAICRCSRRPKGRSWPHNDPESGECRLRSSPTQLDRPQFADVIGFTC